MMPGLELRPELAHKQACEEAANAAAYASKHHSAQISSTTPVARSLSLAH
jgi:hypothetical protein